VILPFPNGVVRSGSKVGSRYKGLPASTNDAYCPTLRAFSAATEVPLDAACVLEIVIDGLELRGVQDAMRVGINAASGNGALRISAGNYGGDLGQYRIGLYELLQAAT